MQSVKGDLLKRSNSHPPRHGGIFLWHPERSHLPSTARASAPMACKRSAVQSCLSPPNEVCSRSEADFLLCPGGCSVLLKLEYFISTLQRKTRNPTVPGLFVYVQPAQMCRQSAPFPNVTGYRAGCTCGSGSPRNTGDRRSRRRGFPPARKSLSGCRSATGAG